MAEIEGKGLDYERYALNRLFAQLARRRAIRTVLEIPAGGEKAMPSLYSLGFAKAGCAVTLVNGREKSKPAWESLGLAAQWIHCEDLRHTGLPNGAFDLVWNFVYLAQEEHQAALLREMGRLSARYVLFVGVNRFNPGFFSHRFVHRLRRIPWTHGDVAFMNPFRVSRYFTEHGLTVLQRGVVDTPPYPDSLGFRDVRLHRLNADLSQLDWDSRTIGWMKADRYPLKIRLLYLFERLPLPFAIKLLYAHLFYVLAERPR